MAIRGRGIVKEFGDPPTRVLPGIDLDIADGEFVSISGRSGSGKSTLLYILSSLDSPTSGLVEIDGRNPVAMSVQDLHFFRTRRIGFVFQFHYLLPELTAIENVLLAPRNLGLHEKMRPEAESLLARFGLVDKAGKLPNEMSGGEQQRVAIARALIMKPAYLFADEPTGNLDTANAAIVMELLREVNRQGTTVLMVTHDPGFAASARREITLVDGRVSSDVVRAARPDRP
jgi:putative ABC transport system ATP-binding protein/lipoprotein-releasing system ATP-binding protein